ncbi:hypothetical protein [Rudaea sp.]|uniref:hypothetical protein n=1 Tax=Rudaea sp. TaxID=2136325 RepID=UPI002ED39B38
MKARSLRQSLGLLLALLFALCGSYASAAEKAAAKPTGNIAERWVVWPKAGQEKAFEAAIKEYVAWRKKSGDPFHWVGYQPLVGTDLTFYVFRSDEHQWKDFDAEDAWNTKVKEDEAYDKMLSQYVAKVQHFYEETDAAHSHMVGNPGDYKYFQVLTRNLKSGAGGDARASIAKIHKALQDQKWPYPYRLAWGIGGKDSWKLIIPLKSYADMADPTPSVREVLTKALGADDAAATLKQYGSSFEFVDDSIFVARPDLSSQK